MTNNTDNDILIEITSDIICAYVSNNAVTQEGLPSLISSVYTALKEVDKVEEAEEAVPLRPAVSVKKSITPDYIICLEDGKKFKSLKRHLRTHYNMSPEEYREKWSLPADYPMVAPSYASARSELAKKMGLGQQARKSK